MSNFDRTNTGTLSRNKNPQSEKSPEYLGSINVEGKEYYLSAWVKEGKERETGKPRKFFSLAVKPKDAMKMGQTMPHDAKGYDQATQDQLDQDVPF